MLVGAWGDDDGFNFTEEVGNEPFTLEVIVSEGRMEVILNDDESMHMHSHLIETDDASTLSEPITSSIRRDVPVRE